MTTAGSQAAVETEGKNAIQLAFRSVGIAKLTHTYSAHSVIYWDVPSSAIIKRFTGHNARINSVAFNSESTVLASASFDASIRLWDLRSQQGKPIQVLQDAKDSVTCVVIGDREIVASSVDGHVRTYDLRAGELRADFFDRELSDVFGTYWNPQQVLIYFIP